MRMRRIVAILAVALFMFWLWSSAPATAGSTGNLSGTVVASDTGAPLGGAAVTAVAPSGTYKATSDGNGFYVILNMAPDTYTVTFSSAGYDAIVIRGINVFQDQTASAGAKLIKTAKLIGRIPVTAQATNLVQASVPSDTYNITSSEIASITNDTTHHTLYDVLWRTAGVTSNATNNSPIIRGGINTELGWEWEEVPLVDRTVGYYVTELSTTGLNRVEVTTGGLSANQGPSSGGLVNMVVKQGTHPANGYLNVSLGSPTYYHDIDFEYGDATPNGAWSWFLGSSNLSSYQDYGRPGVFYYELVEGFDFVPAHDTMINIHHRWGDNNQNDLQYVADIGVGAFRFSYGGTQGKQLAVDYATGCPGNLTGSFVQCDFVHLSPKLNADDWYHWYAIQKIAFSHTINSHSYYRARIATSRNGYYFDEAWAANQGEACLDGSCATLQPGLVSSNAPWCYGCYYQDRHQFATYYNWDYANQLSEKHLLRFGVGYEFSRNFRHVANFLVNGDVLGGWPDFRFITDAPTHLYSIYGSDHITVGRWVIEPGLRWDSQRYSISPVINPLTGKEAPGTQHAFTSSFTSPRLAVTYQAGPRDVFRGSWAYLGQFIGTAYAEDFSIDQINPKVSAYHFSGPLEPTTAHSWDFSWEHNFPNQVSLRITPYWHNNQYVLEYRVPKFIDPTRPTLLTNGARTKTTGLEIAVARDVPQGLSTFLALTYNNTKSNVVSLAGPFFGSRSVDVLANVLANNFVPASYSAPWNANLSLDWKRSGWEVISNTSWSTAYPYGVGRKFYTFDSGGNVVLEDNPGACTDTNQGTVCLASNEAPGSFANSLKGPAWYDEDISVSRQVQRFKVGITVTNLFNNIKNPNLQPDGYYLNTDPGGNWAPLDNCPLYLNNAVDGFNFVCGNGYNAIYPAPNAFKYPVAGYFRTESMPPRQWKFWVRFNI